MVGNILNIRITDKQRKALNKRAELLSISKGALIRQLIDDNVINNKSIFKTELDNFQVNLTDEFYYLNQQIKQLKNGRR